jgi:hypothetical protein
MTVAPVFRVRTWSSLPARGRRGTKRIGAVGLCLTAGLALGASSASANTRWFYERKPIPEGQTVEVAASGNMRVALHRVAGNRIELKCTMVGREAFWDTGANGVDEARALAFDACTSTSEGCTEAAVTATLPFGSFLEAAPSWPLPDKWSGMALIVVCDGVGYGPLEGTLTPGSGDPGAQTPEDSEVIKDEPDSFVGFRPNAGELVASGGDTLKLSGFYRFGTGTGERVEGEQ